MIPELEQLGFTRNEANVYYAALRTGTCSVQQLANATGLNRITVHSIVEKFERLHVFTRSYDGRHRRVHPADPHTLESLLKTDEEALRIKQRSLSAVMPTLREMFRRSQRGMQITTFRGENGLERICEDVLRTGAEMLEYANIDLLNAVIGPYIAKDYLPRKHKLGIPTKFLLVDTPGAHDYIRECYMRPVKAAPMEAKFIDPSVFALDAFFVIYGEKLAILTPSTLEGAIIEDRAIADSLRPFFHFVWNGAGAYVTNVRG